MQQHAHAVPSGHKPADIDAVPWMKLPRQDMSGNWFFKALIDDAGFALQLTNLTEVWSQSMPLSDMPAKLGKQFDAMGMPPDLAEENAENLLHMMKVAFANPHTGRWKITLKPSEGASDVMGIELKPRGGPGRKNKIFVFACESAGASESAIILRDTYIRPLISLCGQLLQQKEELVLRVQHGSSDDGGGRSGQHASSRLGGGGGGYGPSDVMTSSDFDSQSFDAKFVNAAGQVPTDAAVGDCDEGDGDASSTDHSRSPFEGDFGGGVYTSFMALLHCQAQGGADPSDEDPANSHGNGLSTQAHCGRGGGHKIPECTPVSSTQRPAGRSLNIDDDDDDDGGGGGGARAGRPCAAGAASSTMPPPYAQSSAADTGMDSDDSDEEGMAALFAQEAANSQHPRPPSPVGVNILSQAHSRRASGELLLTGSAKRQKHSTSPQSKAASRSRASGGTSATASTQPPAPPKARPGKSKKKRRDRFFGL